jgi:hypothetical protein
LGFSGCTGVVESERNEAFGQHSHACVERLSANAREWLSHCQQLYNRHWPAGTRWVPTAHWQVVVIDLAALSGIHVHNLHMPVPTHE